MLRITKESEYAFLLLSALLESPENAISATSLSQRTGIALPMTGKVLKRLVQQDILTSTRGAYGGYKLCQEALSLSAFDIVQAMEGAPELVDCLNDNKVCQLAHHCHISPFWHQLNHDIQLLLESKTLADMQQMDRRKAVLLDKRRKGISHEQ